MAARSPSTSRANQASTTLSTCKTNGWLGIVKKIQDLPGHELFQFVDHEGNTHKIHSEDVNQYLQEITGEHFTAKDFRTWAGTVLAAMLLREFEPYTTQTQAKKNVVEAIKSVSQRLGNTPSVCRKCYVHPAVLEGYFSAVQCSDAMEAEEVTEEVDKPNSTPYERKN